MTAGISTNLSHELKTARHVAGVTATMIMIGPTLAKLLLELNTHNRRISPAVVEKYGREIANDEWYPTPAGIGIDEHGVLVDGQHRLQAIVNTGATVPMLVVFGLPSNSQQKVDRQNRRSLFDVITLAGITTDRKAVQIASVLARRSLGTTIPADSDVKQALLTHEDAIYAVIKRVPAHKAGVCAAGVMAALTIAWEMDDDKTEQFIDKVVEPTQIANDDPRWRFWKWLQAPMRAGGHMRQVRDFKATCGCVNAFFAGRKMNQVREADDIEMPEPVAA